MALTSSLFCYTGLCAFAQGYLGSSYLPHTIAGIGLGGEFGGMAFTAEAWPCSTSCKKREAMLTRLAIGRVGCCFVNTITHFYHWMA